MSHRTHLVFFTVDQYEGCFMANSEKLWQKYLITLYFPSLLISVLVSFSSLFWFYDPQLYCLLLSHHERQPYCFPFNTMIKMTVNYLQNTKQTMSIDYLVRIMERPSAKGWDVSLRRMNIGLTFIMWPEYKLQLIANVDVCLLVVIFGCKWDRLLKTCEHCSIWQVHCRIGSVALCSADYFLSM